MAKTKISEFSATPANNTDIDGINIAEGCAPSGINNAIRELMSQLKDQQAGTSGDNFTVGGNLAVTGTTVMAGAVTCSAAAVFSSTVAISGVATAPTPTFADDSTKVATTAFVQDAIAAIPSKLADSGANGIVVRTSDGVTTARTLTAANTYLTVTNGDGVSGNPTIDIADFGIGTIKIAESAIDATKLNGGQTGSAPVFASRAWASFMLEPFFGTTASINGSGNISTIVRTGTGLYTVTFVTAMSDANYAVIGSSHGSSGASASLGQTFGVYSKSTTGFYINITDPTSNNYSDPIECGFSVIG